MKYIFSIFYIGVIVSMLLFGYDMKVNSGRWYTELTTKKDCDYVLPDFLSIKETKDGLYVIQNVNNKACMDVSGGMVFWWNIEKDPIRWIDKFSDSCIAKAVYKENVDLIKNYLK